MAGVPSSQWTAPAGAGAAIAAANATDFTKEEKEAIQRCLSLHLGPEYITYRPAPTGGKVAYIEGWRALELANETFGFSGWSSSVQDMAVDFVRHPRRGAGPLDTAVLTGDSRSARGTGSGAAAGRPEQGRQDQRRRVRGRARHAQKRLLPRGSVRG